MSNSTKDAKDSHTRKAFREWLLKKRGTEQWTLDTYTKGGRGKRRDFV